MISATQKAAIEEILNIIVTTTPPRSKRQLSGMFMELVDRTDWPEYYQLIPEPRCLNAIRASIDKNRYRDPLDAYTDLSLVFWNALFYNEPGSQISLDAETLKSLLESEWKKRPILPIPRSSPPPSSAQKVHGTNSEAEPVPASAPTPLRTATPQQQPQPQIAIPTTAYTPAPKPVAIRPRSPQVQAPASPDMDVDVGGLSEGEDIGAGAGMGLRDGESDEIVRQLEKGLPRWKGLGDEGWMAEVTPDRWLEIVHGIKNHKDVIGNRLAAALEAVPEESTISDLSYNTPLSLKIIESNTRAKTYTSSKEFDQEFARLFEKARRWHDPGSEAYGRVLLLQRLYQALTSPSPPSGPPYSSSTSFASLRAGPGTARPLHSHSEGVPGVTTFRVSTKDRTFVEEVVYKGWSIKLADWVHLSNPDDPSRPVIAQVFKVWVSDEISKKGLPGITACWYYRPEQTFHPAHRQFWEGEVFKTSHFADHPLEDLIEKIACQFTARHIRGRPRPPFWYPGWPLYVCDSRYNDRERVFVKIKNWNSCVPEEVRKSTEFMPIYPFERMVFPRRFGSPFLGGKAGAGKGSVVKGPGGLVEGVEKPEGDKGDGPGGRKRPKRAGPGDAGPNKGLYVGIPGVQPSTGTQPQTTHLAQQAPAQPRAQPGPVEDRSIVAAAGGLVNLASSHASIEKLPAETARHFDRDPETNQVLWFSAPPVDIAREPAPQHSLAYLHFVAMKRKKEAVQEDDNSTGMDVDRDDESDAVESRKRQKIEGRKTWIERLNVLLADATAPPVSETR